VQRTITEFDSSVMCIQVKEDSARLFVGLATKQIRIFDVDDLFNMKPIGALEGHHHQMAVTQLKFALNGDLISTSLDSTINVWNLNENKCLKTCYHKAAVIYLKIYPNGHFQTVSLNRVIKI
jgi:WD40 repeat protein